jgi:hypothetical protein
VILALKGWELLLSPVGLLLSGKGRDRLDDLCLTLGRVPCFFLMGLTSGIVTQISVLLSYRKRKQVSPGLSQITYSRFQGDDRRASVCHSSLSLNSSPIHHLSAYRGNNKEVRNSEGMGRESVLEKPMTWQTHKK